MMTHPKMLYTYVGIDSHKENHTAVFINCFFEKLGEITFRNFPSCFEDFLKRAQSFKPEGVTLMFGLEDCGSYGRNLMVFLKSKSQNVKHVIDDQFLQLPCSSRSATGLRTSFCGTMLCRRARVKPPASTSRPSRRMDTAKSGAAPEQIEKFLTPCVSQKVCNMFGNRLEAGWSGNVCSIF